MGTELREPEIKNAIAIPGNTACEIASPTIAIRRKIKKHPNKPEVIATKLPVTIIQNASMFYFVVLFFIIGVLKVMDMNEKMSRIRDMGHGTRDTGFVTEWIGNCNPIYTLYLYFDLFFS